MSDASLSTVSHFLAGLRASASLAIGYIPMAFSFGVVALQADLSPWQAMAISIIVFAGAAQFILVSLLAAGTGGLTALVAVLLLNVRHVFYGPALAVQLTRKPGRWSPLLAFGLTDEAFATAMSEATRRKLPPVWCVGVGMGAYGSWVLGTALGVLLGAGLGDDEGFIGQALSFVLPALFIALLGQAFQRALWPVVVVSAVLTGLSLISLPGHVAMIIGMIGGALVRPWIGSAEEAGK
ncbi:MAG: AzlC family ABC transporter permease [Saccharospirillum sp.]|uniref:AzlC family ABC transporter permease n=1 Tax=Saccharospirillum sp. TaxID=2033801 RepID=UPI003299FC35